MKKIALLAIVLILLALAPLGVQNIINEEVNKQTLLLKDKGINVEVLTQEGYLETNREFSLTIKNEKKFKNFLKESLIEKYPSYEKLIKSLFNEESKELDEFIKGIVFKGNINNSNINYNSDINVNIYLDKFSDEIMNKLRENKEKNQGILSFLHRKALAFDVVLSNKAKFKKLTLKDIDEQSIDKSSNGRVKVLSYFIENKSTDDLLKAHINLDKFLVEASNRINDYLLEISSFNHDITYLNEYINSSDLKLEHLIFTAKKSNLDLSDLSLKTKGEVENALYKSQLNIKTNEILIGSKYKKATLDNLALDIEVGDMNYENVKALNSAYLDVELISLDTTLTKDERAQKMSYVIDNFIKSINDVLNSGATLNAKLDVNNFKNNMFLFKKLDLDVNLILNKNKLSFQTLDKKDILANVDGNVVLLLPKDDFINFMKKINPSVAMLVNAYSKTQNSDVLFDVKIDKGMITVNDKKLN